ncbi:hypothetical protein FT663_04788 [Candidozyma haemuli var. vulneris]|uniref:Uncharacterized protein n=1 Tax=Candidozyma haemuli TaxID=45357 RepID=A0A2V1B2E9_9ASCO|nr:hypothetical protein CXQ85_003881 [[Candida] haemuloni]KAF3986665.1 hypothetical protein FT663_04788 [[Candida] haemuloni var. vulneris]KAF3987866.1 hypothetical protein FT662_03757 [[Candida] haemuloni var. vulneris]PVH23591.1 hypothetical protein CXQ85_003881 [[Candida] haemuloni]
MIETHPHVSPIPLFTDESLPEAARFFLLALQHKATSEMDHSRAIDYWNLLPKKKQDQINEVAFRKTQKVLAQTSIRFQQTYFRFRYHRHPVPRSVYKGYFCIETTPKMCLNSVLEVIKEFSKDTEDILVKQTVSKLEKSNLDSSSMISLKSTSVCYLTAYKEAKPFFDNVMYVTMKESFLVRILAEPVPVLFYLRTVNQPKTVIEQFLTRHDEYDYEVCGPNKYFVLVLFRSNQRPKPFCTKKSTLCYLTPSLARRKEATVKVKAEPDPSTTEAEAEGEAGTETDTTVPDLDVPGLDLPSPEVMASEAARLILEDENDSAGMQAVSTFREVAQALSSLPRSSRSMNLIRSAFNALRGGPRMPETLYSRANPEIEAMPCPISNRSFKHCKTQFMKFKMKK